LLSYNKAIINKQLKTMKKELSPRGFAGIEFRDTYKSKCSLKESSSAMEPKIWFGVDIDFEGKECTPMHLNQEQVEELLPFLQKFVETGEL
jgi:hypothetical protein